MSHKIVTTTCTMDCPDSCALAVTVNDGQVEKIGAGDGNHPNTAGFICRKIAGYAGRVYHPDRLLHPLRRSGPKGAARFERISWEAAISEITDRFRTISQTWGGEAILPYHYGGSNGLMGDELLDHYYFAKLGASRCAKTLCAAPSTAVASEMYGKMEGVAYEDYPRAKFILIWGANPKVSHIHLVPYLREAKRNGAFIAVVDPRNNFSTREIDLHLPVYPGADLPLALGMIHYWRKKGLLDDAFLSAHARDQEPLLAAAEAWPPERAADTAGVPVADLRQLADRYADASPALLRCGWGVERNRNGGQALGAILALPALLGKFGIPGGGYTMSNSGATRLNKERLWKSLAWKTRLLNQTQLGGLLNDETLDPPVKALFVYNCNPAATVPDQNSVLRGLQRDDLFTVVFEQVMTDTAAYADILLPAVTFLEQREIKRGYGSYIVGGVQPAIFPRGEAKPNEAVFALLGRAMNWDDPPFHWDSPTYQRKVAAALSLNGSRVDAEILSAGALQPLEFQGAPPVQFQTVFPNTPDGKINLSPTVLGSPPYRFQSEGESRYPLALISPASSRMISSTLGEYNYPTLYVTLHPRDARARNIRKDTPVRVYNDLGEVHCLARISSSVREGIVSMPKGAWQKSSRNGQTATALCPATVNQVAGGACYNDARVEVERGSDGVTG